MSTTGTLFRPTKYSDAGTGAGDTGAESFPSMLVTSDRIAHQEATRNNDNHYHYYHPEDEITEEVGSEEKIVYEFHY